jgi:ABC-type bacteriocin/lantibiotic exporter with double-glycine peptidase domain
VNTWVGGITMKKKYPIYLQDDATSCGVYCIKMILKYYGIEEDAITMKKKARVDASGTTIKGLIETLKSYHIEATAYHASLEDIEKKLSMPCILHFVIKDQGHFVVLYEIKGDSYIIGDPAKGISVYNKEDLKALYSERVIHIKHIGRYYHYEDYQFKTFFKQLRSLYKKTIRVIVKYSVLISIFTYLVSYLYSMMIDMLKRNTPLFISGAIIGTYAFMAVIKELMRYFNMKKGIYLRRSIDKDCVYSCIRNVMNLPEDAFYYSIGMIHDKLFDLYTLSEECVQICCIMYSDTIMLILLLIGLSVISPILTLVSVISLFVIGIYVKMKNTSLLESYKASLHAHNDNSEALFDYLQLRRVAKCFMGSIKWLKRYEHYYEQDQSLRQDYEEDQMAMSLSLNMMMVLSQVGILSLGLWFYKMKVITMGILMMYIIVNGQLVEPLVRIASVWSSYKQCQLLYERYKEFMGKEEMGSEHLDRVQEITLSNVSFSYGYGEYVIKHRDLKIDHSLFMLGKTGCGKSTLLKLMAGFDRHYSGEIFINDLSLRKIYLPSLMKHVLYVDNKEAFMNGTLYENLMCEDLSLIKEVFQVLGCDYLTKLSMPIKQDGRPFSRGEATLVILARALLKNADVYLLDELFSGLEIEQAKSLIERIKAYKKQAIFVIVTHQRNLMNSDDDYVIIE